MTGGPRHIDERPRVVEVDEVVRQIRTWVEGGGRGLRVGGLFGERGSGKTSRIVTLMRGVYGDRAAGCDDSALLFDPGDAMRAFPAFAMVHHLRSTLRRSAGVLKPRDQRRDGECEAEDDDQSESERQILRLLSKIDDRSGHLDLARQYGSTKDLLGEKYGEAWQDLVRAPDCLRAELKKWLCAALMEPSSPRRRVLIAVDDFDLYPDQAYGLLEWIAWNLSDCPVTVLVAADRRDLQLALAHSLERRLGREMSERSAANILRKWIPMSWHVRPVAPSARLSLYERVRRAAPEAEPSPSAIDAWSPDLARLLALQPALLPPGPRRMIAWHNELVSAAPLRESELAADVQRGAAQLGLTHPDDAWTAYALVLAVEHGWPTLDVRERFFSDPDALGMALRRTLDRHADGPEEVPTVVDARSAADAWQALALLLEELRFGVDTVEVIASGDDPRRPSALTRVIRVDPPHDDAPHDVWLQQARVLREGVAQRRPAAAVRPVTVLFDRALPGVLAIELGWQLRSRDIVVGDVAPLAQATGGGRRSRAPFFDDPLVSEPADGSTGVMALRIDLAPESPPHSAPLSIAGLTPSKIVLLTRESSRASDLEFAAMASEVADALRALAREGATTLLLAVCSAVDVAVLIGHLIPDGLPPIELFEPDLGNTRFWHCFRLGEA